MLRRYRGFRDAVSDRALSRLAVPRAGRRGAPSQAAAGRGVFVGSGISAGNVRDYAPLADGLIVGSSLKANGDVQQPVDPLRVKELLARLA